VRRREATEDGPANIAFGFVRVPLSLRRDFYAYGELWYGRTVADVAALVVGPLAFPEPDVYGPAYYSFTWKKARNSALEAGKASLIQRYP
jgi:hypothetical protein